MFDGRPDCGLASDSAGDDEPFDLVAALAALAAAAAAQARVDERIRTGQISGVAAWPARPVNAAVLGAVAWILVGAAERWILFDVVALGVMIGFALVATGRVDRRVGAKRRGQVSWRVRVIGGSFTLALIVADAHTTPDQRWWLGIILSSVAAGLSFALALRARRRQAEALA